MILGAAKPQRKEQKDNRKGPINKNESQQIYWISTPNIL